MHFKPTNIRRLTFRRGLFGYRVSDVKDFTRRVVEDYESYQEVEDKIAFYEKELEATQQQIGRYKDQINSLYQQNELLAGGNERLSMFEVEFGELEKMKQLAQHTADTVEKEARQLLEDAEKEKKRIIEETEAMRLNHLLNIQLELEKVLQEKEQIKTEVHIEKGALVDLKHQIEALLVQKETVAQEISFMKDNLTQEFSKSMDAIINENSASSNKQVDDSAKVVNLTTKRII